MLKNWPGKSKTIQSIKESYQEGTRKYQEAAILPEGCLREVVFSLYTFSDEGGGKILSQVFSTCY